MKRTTLYAAFDKNGTPAINVWEWNRAALETHVSDRKANGQALEGEHIVQVTVAHYNRLIVPLGLTPVSAR